MFIFLLGVYLIVLLWCKVRYFLGNFKLLYVLWIVLVLLVIIIILEFCFISVEIWL